MKIFGWILRFDGNSDGALQKNVISTIRVVPLFATDVQR